MKKAHLTWHAAIAAMAVITAGPAMAQTLDDIYKAQTKVAKNSPFHKTEYMYGWESRRLALIHEGKPTTTFIKGYVDGTGKYNLSQYVAFASTRRPVYHLAVPFKHFQRVTNTNGMYSFQSSELKKTTFNPMGYYNSKGVYVPMFYNQGMNTPGRLGTHKEAYFQSPREYVRSMPADYALGLGGKALITRQRGTSYASIAPALGPRHPNVVFFRSPSSYIGATTYERAYYIPEPSLKNFVYANEHLLTK